MGTKNFTLIAAAVLLVVAGIGLYLVSNNLVETSLPDHSVVATSTSIEQDEGSDNEELLEGKIKADTFTGRLEEVNTGCFADGECYVVVDGNHVTTIMGWSQETVGSVQGVEGFGDLENYIGTEVEVYAQVNPDGTYTLYGSEGFYLELLGGVSQGNTGQGIAVGEPNPSTPPSNGDEPKPQIVKDGCMVGGCSAQLCGEAEDMRDMVTTCEYSAQYACYQVATCEKQASGKCGWTETPELAQCISDADSNPVLLEN